MDYDETNPVLDFARRTKKNLEFIERSHISGRLNSENDVYEVTQLINSLLGLLVFPQQKFYDAIPETPLAELMKAGWPAIVPVEGRLREDNLRQLLRYLRNGVSHFNLEFLTDRHNRIYGISIWNTPPNSDRPDWKVNLSLQDLKKIIYKFIDTLEERINLNSTEN